MLKPTLDCRCSPEKITSVENRRPHWLLPIFVAIAWTNLVGTVPALSAEETHTPIASINLSLTNHAITVQAAISAIQEPSGARAPYVVSLMESNATVPLVYWSDMQPKLAEKVKVGNVIRAKVKVSLYRDRLQLRISGPDAIDLVSAAPSTDDSTNSPAEATNAPPPVVPATPSSPPVRAAIGNIKEDWVGRWVIISGTISGSDNGEKSRRLSVQDATGEIQVVLGESELINLPIHEWLLGRVVKITGPVNLVDEKLTVVPQSADAVTLVR
ncbi:MAG: hypothetical protein ABSA12_00945 [Verrucomicrobiia bacterium]|jgi:hypothetical protein